MPRGRPKVALVLSDAERDQLLAMTRSRSLPHALVRRVADRGRALISEPLADAVA